MKGVTMLKPHKAMSELHYNDHRGCVGLGRFYRRMFWHAHRREANKVVAEQLADATPFMLANVFTACAEMDALQAASWEEEAHIERRLIAMRKRADDLVDELYEVNDARERLSDRLYELRHGDYDYSL